MSGFSPPDLEGERVRLEALAPEHSAGMFELWSSHAVCEHSGPCEDSQGRRIALPAATPDESDRLLRFWLDRAEAGTGFRWAVVAGDAATFVGAVGFNRLGNCAQYAYHLSPQHQGRGLASEASRLALRWAFAAGSQSVEAFIVPDNDRSRQLARALGFHDEGPAEDGLLRYLLWAGELR
jgi:ribosomal-protein-alanine N-acetyltransferase